MFVQPRRFDNLWANGVREFFLTAARYEELMDLARAEKIRQREERETEKKEERRAFSRAVREMNPAGMTLLRQLNEALPRCLSTMMYSSPIAGSEEEPLITLRASGDEVKILLGILQRGLSADNGTDS